MEKLKEALAEKGVKLSGLAITDDYVIRVAKGMGIEPLDYLERDPVRVGPYTNKRKVTNTFVKTPAYIVGRKDNGLAQTVQGLMFRAEILDQVLADLNEAKRQIEAGELVETLNPPTE